MIYSIYIYIYIHSILLYIYIYEVYMIWRHDTDLLELGSGFELLPAAAPPSILLVYLFRCQQTKVCVSVCVCPVCFIISIDRANRVCECVSVPCVLLLASTALHDRLTNENSSVSGRETKLSIPGWRAKTPTQGLGMSLKTYQKSKIYPIILHKHNTTQQNATHQCKDRRRARKRFKKAK